jgi:hypothetical protein
MKRLSYVVRQQKQEEAVALKQKALEPQCRHCYIQKKIVNILVEYPDYKGPHFKGAEGAIYCENIVECYQANVKCRYSGLSPMYPDPFLERDVHDEEADDESDLDDSEAAS